MELSEAKTIDDMWLWCQEHNNCAECLNKEICEKMKKAWEEAN